MADLHVPSRMQQVIHDTRSLVRAWFPFNGNSTLTAISEAQSFYSPLRSSELFSGHTAPEQVQH